MDNQIRDLLATTGTSIVLDDADLELALDGVLYGCLAYSGQVCESGTRALVPRRLHAEFVDRILARAQTIVVGPPGIGTLTWARSSTPNNATASSVTSKAHVRRARPWRFHSFTSARTRELTLVHR